MSEDYLIDFRLSEIPQERIDILILGSGVAALSAALSAAQTGRVLLVTKGKIWESNTDEAQGGIAVALREDDSWQEHLADTLAAGDGLCNQAAVEILVRDGPRAVGQLISRGARFDRKGDKLCFTREGAHHKNRIVHACGDATGHEVAKTLIRQVRENPRIAVWEEKMALDLLCREGRCWGALILGKRSKIQAVLSASTIVATGGIGQLYRETTNARVATGDGMAMAYRAGAALMDMEFVQFHPTTLYLAGAPRFLISESVRGEGGLLRNKDGWRFMPDYHEMAELAPRDVVSRAIVDQVKKTRSPAAYLDMRHLSPRLITERFPTIVRLLGEYGLDPTRDLIPIRPSAHYMMGGVKTDLEGRATLPGVYACGEVACTGLHGANRLASNSLLEGLVFGERAGRAASAERIKIPHLDISSVRVVPKRISLDIEDVRMSLKSLLWRYAGIERNGEDLEEAMAKILFWKKYVLGVKMRNVSGWELQNKLTVAEWIVDGAWQREESRGGHFRLDFPARNDREWKKHIEFRKSE